MAEDERFCFVLSPIGSPTSEARRRANGIIDEIIQPALPDFRVERADHDKAPGIVTERIVENVLDADLVVADLTNVNPNVMYELAVRHATGEPFVQMMEQGGELPFDIGDVNTVFFTNDLPGRREAIENLKEAAESALEEGDVRNPIQRTVQFRGLVAEEGSEEEVLIETVRDVRSQMSELRALVSQDAGHSPPGVQYHMPPYDLEVSRKMSGSGLRCAVCSKSFGGERVGTLTIRKSGGGSMNLPICEECFSFESDPVILLAKAEVSDETIDSIF